MLGIPFTDTSKSPVETGGSLSTHEMVRNRIATIMNTRERVHVAIPLPKELMPSQELMNAAALQALKMVEQGTVEQQSTNVVELPVRTEVLQDPEDLTEVARQRVNDAFNDSFKEAA